MAGIADYFAGRVSKRNYKVALGSEQRVTYFLDGQPQGYYYVFSYATYQEEVFVFEGVPTSLKDTTDDVTVTDVGGSSYTVSLSESLETSGTLMVETDSNRVDRERMSPHMWRIVVTKRTGSIVDS